MATQTEIAQRNHQRAVRYFWVLLIGATAASLIGNITHAVLPYLPHVVIQIGAAAVPPIALLAAVPADRTATSNALGVAVLPVVGSIHLSE
jgi:hypothetical protein